MKRAVFVTLLLAGSLACLGIVSCGSENGESGYTLSGTLQKSGVANGVKAYLKLVDHGQPATAPARYFAVSAPFSNGTATYSISGVKAGTYTGWAFIDVNGNAPGDNTSMPDTGDFAVSEGGEIVISGDTTKNLSEDVWIQL